MAFPLDLSAHAACGRSPINLVVVTAADRAAATLRRRGTNPSARFAGTSPFRGGFLCVLKPEGRNVRSTSSPRRAFQPLSTGPSLKTERFQRGRSCGTGGNPVRGAPARLHRHKQFVRGGSGGRHAAWKPCRPPAAFGSFPLRERNSHVRRRAKLPQAASSSYLCAYFSPT